MKDSLSVVQFHGRLDRRTGDAQHHLPGKQQRQSVSAGPAAYRCKRSRAGQNLNSNKGERPFIALAPACWTTRGHPFPISLHARNRRGDSGRQGRRGCGLTRERARAPRRPAARLPRGRPRAPRAAPPAAWPAAGLAAPAQAAGAPPPRCSACPAAWDPVPACIEVSHVPAVPNPGRHCMMPSTEHSGHTSTVFCSVKPPHVLGPSCDFVSRCKHNVLAPNFECSPPACGVTVRSSLATPSAL